MEKITLKRTDLTVSRVCFGTMTFGSQLDQAGAEAIVNRCLDAGVNFFDTANIYNKGTSEVMLGKALGQKRNEIVLASKVFGKMGDAPNESGLSRTAILQAVEASLKRLGTDYLDIYYMHQPDYSVPMEESLEAMDRLVRDGKVLYPASSNYSSWQVTRMLWIAEASGYAPPYISQPMYNLLARGIEQEFLPMAEEMDVSTVIYNPLAGGLLTGKHKPEAPLPGTRFDDNQMYLDRYWHPAQFEAVAELGAAARQAGRSLVSLALNWLLHHTQADCIILGASSLQQIKENLNASEEGALPADVLGECDRVWAKLRGITPRYNR